MDVLILLQNWKYHSKKLMKQVNGLRCFGEVITLMKQNIISLIENVQL